MILNLDLLSRDLGVIHTPPPSPVELQMETLFSPLSYSKAPTFLIKKSKAKS